MFGMCNSMHYSRQNEESYDLTRPETKQDLTLVHKLSQSEGLITDLTMDIEMQCGNELGTFLLTKEPENKSNSELITSDPTQRRIDSGKVMTDRLTPDSGRDEVYDNLKTLETARGNVTMDVDPYIPLRNVPNTRLSRAITEDSVSFNEAIMHQRNLGRLTEPAPRNQPSGTLVDNIFPKQSLNETAQMNTDSTNQQENGRSYAAKWSVSSPTRMSHQQTSITNTGFGLSTKSVGNVENHQTTDKPKSGTDILNRDLGNLNTDLDRDELKHSWKI